MDRNERGERRTVNAKGTIRHENGCLLANQGENDMYTEEIR